jgi:hypothetical protein
LCILKKLLPDMFILKSLGLDPNNTGGGITYCYMEFGENDMRLTAATTCGGGMGSGTMDEPIGGLRILLGTP